MMSSWTTRLMMPTVQLLTTTDLVVSYVKKSVTKLHAKPMAALREQRRGRVLLSLRETPVQPQQVPSEKWGWREKWFFTLVLALTHLVWPAAPLHTWWLNPAVSSLFHWFMTQSGPPLHLLKWARGNCESVLLSLPLSFPFFTTNPHLPCLFSLAISGLVQLCPFQNTHILIQGH